MGMIDSRMRQTERVLSGVLCVVLVWPAAAAAPNTPQVAVG